MPGWLTALIALLRAWLGIRADIAQKQAEHVGAVVQTNKDLTAEVKELQDGRKIENRVLSEPDGAAEQWLRQHRPHD